MLIFLLLFKDGYLLDVSNHILYTPLPCRTPLPGFEHFRFSVSQYEEKDRLLLRNLCFTLGAKFVEKLNKKVTHLLCKFTSGSKYEAACKWGIHRVTCDWIYECVKQVCLHYPCVYQLQVCMWEVDKSFPAKVSNLLFELFFNLWLLGRIKSSLLTNIILKKLLLKIKRQGCVLQVSFLHMLFK